MAPSCSPSSERSCNRRRFLLGAGGAMVAGGLARPAAAAERVTRSMVIPAVPEFENNYTGQFLTILGRPESETNPERIHEACEDVPWPTEATAENEGQLTDRQSDEPLAVRLPVYLDGRNEPIEEDALFIVSNASSCSGDYVVVQTSPVNLRSVRGEPSGPEADGAGGTADDGAGLGLLAGGLGAAGAVGALLARARRGRE